MVYVSGCKGVISGIDFNVECVVQKWNMSKLIDCQILRGLL